MKLFLHINKVLLVIAALCFIFIGVAGNNLSHGNDRHSVLYDKNDCNGKLLIEEKGGAIYMRSKESTAGDNKVMKYQMAEFHPTSLGKMFIE